MLSDSKTLELSYSQDFKCSEDHCSVYVKLNWMFKFKHLKGTIAAFVSNAISGHKISFEIKHTIKHNFRFKLGKS